MHIIHLSLSLSLSLAISTQSATAESIWTASGFNMPESVIFDETGDRIIVSEMVGGPGNADGEGNLALLATDGTVLDPAWTTGLNAPKGMGIVGDILLVADLTQIHEIDLKSGGVLRSIDVPNAIFLNDIATQGNTAFISDFMGNSIWSYEASKVSLWLAAPELHHPNGLLIDGEQLLVGSWGAGLNPDFTTQSPGDLLSISLGSKNIEVMAQSLGNLDGIARMGNDILVSDWVTGTLLTLSPQGQTKKVEQFAAGLADIVAHDDTVYLPMMLDGTILAHTK